MSGFMKAVLKNRNCALSGRFFFLARNESQNSKTKVDDVKIKRKSVLFPSSTRISSLHCPPFSIFCPFKWLGEGLKV